MSWLFSRALMEAYENLRSSQALVAEYSEDTCSDGELSVQSSTNSTPPAYLYNDRTTGCFLPSRYGMTFAPLTEDRGEDLLTWFREGFLAKTSAQQVMASGSTESDPVCGQSLPESFAKYDPSGCWLKTPITSEPRVLDEFSKTWPVSGMMLRGECYQQKTLGVSTKERECGSWPTPQASDNRGRGNKNSPAIKRRLEIGKQITLSMAMEGPLDPEHVEWLMAWPIGWTDLKPLATGRSPSAQPSPFSNWLESFYKEKEVAGDE